MDKYTSRGNLIGGSPLLRSSGPEIYSMVRSVRIKDLINDVSFPEGVADSKYAEHPDTVSLDSLVFPIFWEHSHVNAALYLEIVFNEGTSERVRIKFTSPLASEVVKTINESEHFQAVTEQGY